MLCAKHHKLASERGASISMALMLLLVCTTVAGVALTAATVVAGRQARLKELDSSYYKVTSAASVFWDELKDLNNAEPLSIVRKCDAVRDVDGKIVTSDVRVTFDSNPSGPANSTLFNNIACDLVFGRKRADTDLTNLNTKRQVDKTMFDSALDWQQWPTGDVKRPSFEEDSYKPFKVSVKSSEVNVTVTPRQNGIVEFLFSEDEDPSTTCTLTASVSITSAAVPPVDNHYQWNDSVVWTPLNMNVGGAS